MSLILSNPPYDKITDNLSIFRSEFDGTEPRPTGIEWHHGDGPPDWLNSGWVYQRTLYLAKYHAERCDTVFRALEHIYLIDFETWADAKIARMQKEINDLRGVK